MYYTEGFIDHLEWVVGTDEEEIPEIDFEQLSSKTSLKFDHQSQQSIRRLLAEYERNNLVWEASPAEEVRNSLKKLLGACEVLEAFLKFGSMHFIGSDYEKLPDLTAWFHTSPRVMNTLKSKCRTCEHQRIPTDGDVAKYLSQMRKNAEVLISRRQRSGRSTNIAQRAYVQNLHEIFIKAGGHGKKCWKDTNTGQFRGAFVELATDLLSYTKHPVENVTIGQFIKKNTRIENGALIILK